MLVVTRYQVSPDDAQFHPLARQALLALTAQRGCLRARVGRNVDDPELWVLATEWRSVGDYRRALSNREVKMHSVPLMYRCISEPTAFEDLTTWDPVSGTAEHVSDLA